MFAASAALFFMLLPQIASAHEVYVLSKDTIARDVAMVSPNPFSAIPEHQLQFFFWGFISVTTVVVVLLLSISRKLELAIDPFLLRAKKYAPVAARLTLGICFLACAYYQSLFGPELPLSEFAGANAVLVSFFFYLFGAMLILNLFVRAMAFIGLIVFGIAVFHYGTYMLTYTNYLGEMLVTFIVGGGAHPLERMLLNYRSGFDALFAKLEKYGFFILRVCFGVAIMFASYYAKFLHSQLALDTVTQYHLTNYFHFEPIFIVLGACIIEFLIGLFFIFGFEIRFTALFFLFFLFLSLLYFGEVIWPHLVLLGVNIVMLLHGYDRYTIGAWLGRKTHLEPVL